MNNTFKQTDIGLIPKDWDIKDLGSVGEYINGYAFKPEDWKEEGKPIIRIQNLNDLGKPFNYYQGEIDSKYSICKDDILVSWSASLGAFKWNRGEAWLNQHIFKAIHNNEYLTKDFFYWVLYHRIDKIALNARGSTMRHVTIKIFRESLIPLPPLPEQKKIAHILSKIQQAIETQEHIIKTTQELKKTLMQKLFTEGLNGEPQKQTEIGLIPESWQVVPLGKYAKILNGYAFKSEDYIKNGVPLIRISNVSFGYLISKDDKYLPKPYIDRYSDYALKEGDLILSLTRPVTSGGMKYCFIEKKHLPALLNQRVGRFKIIDEGLSKKYLFHLIFSKYFIGELEKLFGNSSQQPNVSPSQLESFKIPLPSKPAQFEIANTLNSINSKIEYSQNKVETLKDLFTSSLNKLMTGQIRVKGEL